jgi:hypothetical protein
LPHISIGDFAKETIAMQELTQKYLQECFIYNSKTGDLVWKERPIGHFKNKKGMNIFNGRSAGNVAGTEIKIRKLKYRKIWIMSKTSCPVGAHSVIWMLVHGEWPENIDHIDGNGLNNRLENLRNVTHSENLMNCRVSKANTSGCTGVFWNKNLSKWASYIRKEKKHSHLGYFSDWFEAVCARKSAEYRHGYHENHGRR